MKKICKQCGKNFETTCSIQIYCSQKCYQDSKRINLVGKKFGKLLVIAKAENDKNGKSQWRCKCECGTKTIVRANNLLGGYTKSCGRHKEKRVIHGERKTRLYTIWTNMKRRCLCKTSTKYSLYGGRGIEVNHDWKENFISFRDWSMNNGYRDDLTIDRIDVNGNYEPNNCRWVTPKEQCRNTRKNVFITLNNETHCISEWGEKFGIKPSTIAYRLKAGWKEEQAIKTPSRREK